MSIDIPALTETLEYVLTPFEVVALSDEARASIANAWKAARAVVEAPTPDIEAIAQALDGAFDVGLVTARIMVTTLMEVAFGGADLLRRSDV